LGEHEEESSRKITELEALCKKLRDDTQRLEEEKATLEEMVESHDELLIETARETRLDRMGEDAPPPPAPPATIPEEINKDGPMEAIPEQEVLMPHEVIMAEAKPKIP
jgi:hypothetical protein